MGLSKQYPWGYTGNNCQGFWRYSTASGAQPVELTYAVAPSFICLSPRFPHLYNVFYWGGVNRGQGSPPVHQPPLQLRSECYISANNKSYCYYNWWGVCHSMCAVLSALIHYLILSLNSPGRRSLVHLSLRLIWTGSSWKHLWSTVPHHPEFPHQTYHLQFPDEENDFPGIQFMSQKKKKPQFT